MKRYSLLRNNRESGPYTFRELKALGLAANDLIWIEGESTSWTYPTEIDELSTIASQGIIIPLASGSEEPQNHTTNSTPFYAADRSAYPSLLESDKSTGGIEDYSPYLTDKEKPIEWNAKRQKRGIGEVSTSLFSLGVLLVGVMMCAFVVKKLVEHFDIEQPLSSAEAIEITRETLPVSTSVNQGKAGQLTTASILPAENVEQSPAVIVTSSMTKPAGKEIAATEKTASEATEKSAVEEAAKAVSLNADVKEEQAEKEAEKPVTEKVVKKEPSLTISANDYKVGVFGGISDLELAIANPSDVAIEKATVEVDYLKPNGSVVKSQTMSVENISPGGSKKIQVPSSSRGVKVQYRIVSMNAANNN